ncbi:MAG: hypothetical protein IJ257_00665 [Treponema sp.]|nr:hypothetical protein [Treponema sp.]
MKKPSKKIVVVIFSMLVLVSGVFAAAGHIRSQKMNCRGCGCTYFSHSHDVGSHCYCSCGHSYQSHSYR